MKVEWLGQPSQGCEMYCHDLEVMGSNLVLLKLGVRSTSIYVIRETTVYQVKYYSFPLASLSP